MSSTILAQCLEETSRRGIFGLILILRFEKDWHSIRLDRMQLSFKKLFQLVVFQKLWDWRLEKSYLRNHTCLLDHHQRSHYDTITIGPEGKFNWGSTVDQQSEGKVVRQSRGEVQNATFSQLTQPIPKPICDRSGQPEDTQGAFVVNGETSRFHEINEKGFHGELCSSDRSGQPDITPSVIKAHNLSENIRVEQIHDRSGQPDECNSSSAHTVKEQHAPDEHREIASFNTNNEFNRAINEEDIDFNVPSVPHSTVKQLQSASVRELIQKIEKPPEPTCSSTRPTTESII